MRCCVWLPTILVATACSAGPTSDDSRNGTPAHGVEVVATAVRQVAQGDSIEIRITNTGTATAFISRCGNSPLILLQQRNGLEWTGGVQNFACPVPILAGPVQLEAKQSITAARIFADAGRYRFLVPVGSMQDLSDATQAASNAFDVR